MANNIIFQLPILIIVYLGFMKNSVDAQCTYLTAYSYDQTLDSHPGYGFYDYFSYTDDCWIIQADDSSKSINIDSQNFDLEADSTCSYDYLRLYDGNTNSYYNDWVKYCGSGSLTITSSGAYIYLQFYTDGSATGDGFQLTYKQVESYQYNSYEWDNTSHNLQSGLDWWVIMLIIFGVIVLLIIIVIVVIVVVVVCILKGSKNRGRVVNAPARQGGTMVVQYGQTSYMSGTGGAVVQPPPYGQPGMHPPGYSQTVVSHKGGMGVMAVQQQQSSYPQQLGVNLQQQGSYPQHPTYQQKPPAPQMNYAARSNNPNDVPPPPVYTDPHHQQI